VAEIAVSELGYVGLGVSDLSRWRVFAGEVLGMECVEAGDNLHLLMDYWNCRYPASPRRSVDNRKRGGVRRLDRPNDPLNQIRRAHPEAAWAFLPSQAAAARSNRRRWERGGA
jgi:catechol 2,3-dioxygenase-like lactoylglutathione lyase family enzyme